MNSTRQLRSKRTRESNKVRSTIAMMLGDSMAKHIEPDGLPSWWPFWSDCLKDNVRAAVRAARAIREAEELTR